MGPTFLVEYGSLLRASALAFQPQWGLSGGVILYALAEWLTANYRGFPRKNLNLLGDCWRIKFSTELFCKPEILESKD